MTIKPTAADREAADALDRKLIATMMGHDRAVVLDALARHAQQAWEEALEEAAKVAYAHADMNAGSNDPCIQASEASAIGVATSLEALSTKGQDDG